MFVPTIQKLIENKKCFVERRLPVPGKITVTEGEIVKAFDVVGETELKPRDGEKELRGTKREFKLTAGAEGKISRIIQGRAVLVEAVASSVLALLGYGKDVEGELLVIAEKDKEITIQMITADHRGKILVGGSKVTGAVLKKAEALGVKGLVSGGIDGVDTTAIKLPTLITEGFGEIPMNNQIFEFFVKVKMRYVILSVDRKVVLVPLLKSDRAYSGEIDKVGDYVPPKPFLKLTVGLPVQIFRKQFFGHEGKVKNIFSKQVELESGIIENACEVELEGGKVVTVPVRNVGVLV